jgi:hypothetical protein
MSVDWRSRHFAFRGRAGEPPRRFAPAGSLLPRTPAGVFVPSAPINRVLSIKIFNSTYKYYEYVVNSIIKPKESSQSEYEFVFVFIEELVPDDHLLRLIDK